MISIAEVALRLVIALAVGAVIGWERETRGKPAGFRTLTLVSVAVAIFVVTAQRAAFALGEPADSTRAMAAIAQGVGFLGAGAILQSKGEVRWLTTAASLWAAAALGYASGVGQYAVAGLGTVLVFAILRWLPAIEEVLVRTKKKPKDHPSVKKD